MFYTNCTKRQRFLAGLVTAGLIAVLMFLVFMLTTQTALAADDIFDKVGSTFDTLYKKIGVVVTVLAAIALAVCAIRWIMGSDPSTVKVAKSWMLNIAIGLAIYWLAYVIIGTVKAITGESTIEDINSVNLSAENVIKPALASLISKLPF